MGPTARANYIVVCTVYENEFWWRRWSLVCNTHCVYIQFICVIYTVRISTKTVHHSDVSSNKFCFLFTLIIFFCDKIALLVQML